MSQGRVVVAGGHGKVARALIPLLVDSGAAPLALVRNPDHADEVRDWGAHPAVVDLEHARIDDVVATLDGATAAVFAAGAGPGSGPARKDTMDRAGAVLFADAAEHAGVHRFLQISAFGAGEPVRPGGDETWTAYLRAKSAAEDDLRARTDLDWTILRPGRLTDDPPTGLVRLTRPPLERGDVARADVAAVIVALLDAPASFRQTLLLTAGTMPIAEAVAAL